MLRLVDHHAKPTVVPPSGDADERPTIPAPPAYTKVVVESDDQDSRSVREIYEHHKTCQWIRRLRHERAKQRE